AIGAGGFAPTSLYGIVTYSTAHDAGIDLSPFLLFGIAVVVYLVMLAVAYFMFGRSLFSKSPAAVGARSGGAADGGADSLGAQTVSAGSTISRGSASAASVAFGEDDEDEALFDSSSTGESAVSAPFTFVQILTVIFMVGLIGSVVVLAA